MSKPIQLFPRLVVLNKRSLVNIHEHFKELECNLSQVDTSTYTNTTTRRTPVCNNHRTETSEDDNKQGKDARKYRGGSRVFVGVGVGVGVGMVVWGGGVGGSRHYAAVSKWCEFI